MQTNPVQLCVYITIYKMWQRYYWICTNVLRRSATTVLFDVWNTI